MPESAAAKLKLDTGSLSGLGLNRSFVAQTRLFPGRWPRGPMEGIAVARGGRRRTVELRQVDLP